jgi:hypothetical protein
MARTWDYVVLLEDEHQWSVSQQPPEEEGWDLLCFLFFCKLVF